MNATLRADELDSVRQKLKQIKEQLGVRTEAFAKARDKAASLVGQYEDAQCEAVALGEQLEGSREEVAKLTEALQDAKKLQRMMDQGGEAGKLELVDQLQAVTKVLDETKASLLFTSKELQAAKSRTKDEERRASSLAQDARSKHDEAERLSAALAESRALVKLLQSDLDAQTGLLEQLQTAGEVLKQTKMSLADTGEALQTKEGELKRMTSKCEEASRKVGSTEAQLKEKAAEVERLEAAVARARDLQRQGQGQTGGDSAHAGLMGELDAAEEKLKATKAVLSEKTKALGDADDEVGSLKGRCEEAEGKIVALREKLKESEELTERLQAALKEAKKLQRVLDEGGEAGKLELVDQLQAATKVLDETKSSLMVLSKELQAAKNQTKEVERKASLLEDGMTEKQSEIEKLQAALDESERLRVEKLKRELAESRPSPSPSLASPL